MAEKLAEVAETGDVRATLECLRDRVAERIDRGCGSRELASLSLRLMVVMGELDRRGS